MQGRNDGGKGGAIPRAPNHCGSPNGCGGAKVSRQVFLFLRVNNFLDGCTNEQRKLDGYDNNCFL